MVLPVTTSQNRRYIPMGFVSSNVIASNAILITNKANTRGAS
ncbi:MULTISPECIES: type IIL restriction-modification enzyme MmeI [Lactobacillus]